MTNFVTRMVKPKKWAMCLGYSGKGYYGMQRQTCNKQLIEELPTIESELLSAMHDSGCINENEMKEPSVMHFQRAARTDKGVSAVKQIVTLNVFTDLAALLPKINNILPQHIRVFGAKRTTKYFDSKNFCDGRTYSYLLPSYAICPVTDLTTESFRVTSESVKEFNHVLKSYEGTRNFHNFTAHKKPTDPSAKRFIMSFDCSGPFMLGNDQKELEFLVARVKGQSFMLHQIRKMIGLAIAIMRGLANQSLITRAFGTEKLDIPMAPGLGLLLEEVHYDRYNQKYGGDGIHEPILWDEVNEQIMEFRDKHIYSEIINTEITEISMFNWLQTLPLHTYDIRAHQPLSDGASFTKPLIKANYNASQSETQCEPEVQDTDQSTLANHDNETNTSSDKRDESEMEKHDHQDACKRQKLDAS